MARLYDIPTILPLALAAFDFCHCGNQPWPWRKSPSVWLCPSLFYFFYTSPSRWHNTPAALLLPARKDVAASMATVVTDRTLVAQETAPVRAMSNPSVILVAGGRRIQMRLCPLNVCCSPYGFCGTTTEFCGNVTFPEPSCSGTSASKRTIGYYEGWAVTGGCDSKFYPQGLDVCLPY